MKSLSINQVSYLILICSGNPPQEKTLAFPDQGFWQKCRKIVLYNKYYETFDEFKKACKSFLRQSKGHKEGTSSLLTENFQNNRNKSLKPFRNEYIILIHRLVIPYETLNSSSLFLWYSNLTG